MPPPSQYWGPITSSVDFCEPNYALSPYVAEPANALSSLLMVAAGVAGLAVANPRRGDPAGCWGRSLFGVLYAGLAVIGVGSALLHTCLTAPAQALDEVPMLLFNVALLACLTERAVPRGGRLLNGPWVLSAALATGVAMTVVYVRFRSFYAAFLGVYVVSVAVVIGWTGRLALRPRADARAERMRAGLILPLWGGAMGFYICCGAVAWATDFLLCGVMIEALGNPLGAMVRASCCAWPQRGAAPGPPRLSSTHAHGCYVCIKAGSVSDLPAGAPLGKLLLFAARCCTRYGTRGRATRRGLRYRSWRRRAPRSSCWPAPVGLTAPAAVTAVPRAECRGLSGRAWAACPL